MAERVDLNSDGAAGYLHPPPGGSGPGVVVVQEWWGVDSGIKAKAQRIADAGFIALVPDLYRGALAAHDEMDRAAELMNGLPPDRAARDMSAAVDYLSGLGEVTGDGLGVVGFCMGGMLALLLAASRGDKIKAAVPFYGYPPPPMEPDWSGLSAVVRGHMAENDDYFPLDGARALEAKLRVMGKDVEFTVHPGTGHAFMGPDALGTLDEALAEKLWPEVAAFLHDQLG